MITAEEARVITSENKKARNIERVYEEILISAKKGLDFCTIKNIEILREHVTILNNQGYSLAGDIKKDFTIYW